MMRPEKRQEAGFTLVELLVVVAIIGILAAVAVSQYALYKQKASDAQMEAALQSARQAMEGFYVENTSYVGATVGNLPDHGYRATASVTVNVFGPAFAGNPTDSGYSILACTTGGTSPAMSYDTTIGTMTPATGPCS